MKHDQDFSITAGDYAQLVATIYTDNTDVTEESDLASGVVTWRLRGVGVDLISKSTEVGTEIVVDAPTAGDVTVTILEEDTEDLRSGDYYHIAEFTISGTTRGLFDGKASIDNRTSGD
jgi:hypothetical protein